MRIAAIDTADVVLMRSDPFDIVKAMALSRKVRSKIKQNLFWAAIYNVIAIPIAGGLLYTSLGILLRPEWAALAMAASTITVTVNALLLKQAGLPKAQNQMTAPQAAAVPAVAWKLWLIWLLAVGGSEIGGGDGCRRPDVSTAQEAYVLRRQCPLRA